MALLVVARNGVLFLTGWEVMALSAYSMDNNTHIPKTGFDASGFQVAPEVTWMQDESSFNYAAMKPYVSGGPDVASSDSGARSTLKAPVAQ